MSQLRVAIVGATGYTGAELVRLLSSHPAVEIVAATSGRAGGDRLDKHCPWLCTDLVLSSFDAETVKADVVFLAQESGFAAKVAPTLVQRELRVVDLSADYRLLDQAAYEKHYKMPRAPFDFSVTYGLSELAERVSLTSAALVANPGCYPTATCLALAPFYRAGLIAGTPVVDAKSGVSGAGRSKAETAYLFSEREGSFAPYAVTGHRHVPEIEQTLGVPVRFTPHLIPTPRGMEVTCHIPLAATCDPMQVLRDTYAGSPFVRVVGALPETKQVIGSNRCDIFATIDEHTNYLVTTSVIDNLVKGAAGQAIQNMNIMFGFDETAGLPIHGVWP
ncbi:MAG: N-acetyl-gamma-glutamyl-phosphate reductase [Armatimonadota bacterium]